MSAYPLIRLWQFVSVLRERLVRVVVCQNSSLASRGSIPSYIDNMREAMGKRDYLELLFVAQKSRQE